MKFWIRINGLQEGPMEISEMKDRKITPNTYVWCAGMKDWAYARDVEDLKDVITSEPVMPVAEDDSVQKEPETMPVETAPEVEEDAAEDADDVASAEDEPTAMSEPEPTPEVAPNPTPSPVVPVEDDKPCPPTNLVWAIIATVLCCMPLGVVAIVFAAQVKTKYYAFGYEEAKKYSDRAAWCVIGSVVLSILITPLQLLLSILPSLQ